MVMAEYDESFWNGLVMGIKVTSPQNGFEKKALEALVAWKNGFFEINFSR